jgi:hypothetical protein
MTGYTCPACGYDDLIEPPYTTEGGASYEICPSCGFEPGYTDDNSGHTFESWRRKWIEGGCRWYSQTRRPPAAWDPTAQLQNLQRQ